jgi:hypothetical protein
VALLVWFMTGIALWHFTVFLPDRFWQGIVGAFLGAVTGALVSGAIFQIATGRVLADTDIATVLFALPSRRRPSPAENLAAANSVRGAA